jgi:hypothetical protein
MKHSSMKGDVAVLMATAKFAEAGMVVLVPACEALPFDLVLFHQGQFFRVQVKRAQRYKQTKRWMIPFRKIAPTGTDYTVYRYTTKHADYLCGVVVETGDI